MAKTQDIRDAVERELTYDPLIDASNITVKNLNGDAALNGTVPSYLQYVAAAAAARRVAGVTDVHNHLEVALPPGDYRDDATLTTMANNALMLNITVPDGAHRHRELRHRDGRGRADGRRADRRARAQG